MGRQSCLPNVELLEWDVWLGTLAHLESRTAGEGGGAELSHVNMPHYIMVRCRTYSGWALGAAVVDQLADGVRVVGEVAREVGLGAGVAVGRDEGTEVAGDLLSIGVGQAVARTSLPPVWSLACAISTVASVWRGECGDGEGGSSQDGGECVHGRHGRIGRSVLLEKRM